MAKPRHEPLLYDMAAQEINIRVHFTTFVKDLLRDISTEMSLDDVK